jgi:type IX secretion system substrate protein
MMKTKLGNMFIVMLYIFLIASVASGQSYRRLNTMTFTVGERIPCSQLVDEIASDEVKAWQKRGQAGTVTLYGSTANTDTSEHSWSVNPDAYSWAGFIYQGDELKKLSASSWEILPHMQLESLDLVHTKADSGVWFEVTSDRGIPVYHSANLRFAPDTTVELVFELLSHLKSKLAVYNQLKYEIAIRPRDLYLNTSNEPVDVRFTARFPGEFDDTIPGVTNIFDGILTVQGLTAYLLVSNVQRELGAEEPQLLQVTSVKNPHITGWSNYYEVLPHAPRPFKLIGPGPKYSVELVGHSSPFTFEWEPADDPVQNIVYSRSPHDPHFEEVKYTVVFTDHESTIRTIAIPSDNNGEKHRFTSTHGQLNGIREHLKSYRFVLWHVLATDGTYTTRNLPTGPVNYEQFHIIYINAPVSIEQLAMKPEGIDLHQNYPNPFAGSSNIAVTNIRFETTEYGQVTLKVYDMLGHEVAVLANEILTPGSYMTDFNATGLPSGLYHYTLVAGGKVITKSMVVAR